MVQIICAGYPKTGTKSLHEALEMLGYNNIYDYMEHLDYFINDYQRVLNGEEKVRYVLDKYAKANVDCVIDMPPSFLFEHFYNRWPDAKVILTVREEDAWFKSFQKMNKAMASRGNWMTFFSKTASSFERFMRKLYECMLGSRYENEWLWKLHYRKHNCYVKSVIPSENLLVFEVSDGWGPLCKFLDKKVPDEKFPIANVAGTKGNIINRIMDETNLAANARKEVALNITLSCLVIGGTLFGAWYFYPGNSV